MAGLRFSLDIFIPEDPNGVLVAGIKVPSALAARIPAIRQNIRDLKGFARKINEGRPNEEASVKASYHICRHDSGGSCEAETEI